MIKPFGKRSLEGLMKRDNNIKKMDVRETGCEDGIYI
jgi:hypothetical protein